MKTALVGLLLVVCMAAQADSGAAGPPQTVTVNGWELELRSRGDLCVLHSRRGARTGEQALVPAAPCRFTGRPGAWPQTARFGKKTWQRTLLIVFGTPEDPAMQAAATAGRYCGTVSQAIAVTTREVRISSRVARGGRRCEGGEVDEREFHIFDEEWH